ncbi:MAG: glycosyltransferase [Deltaproteobacteria bacterium]|nr:glycosyltransferase [Deltaproteobacteria bacterium]
MPHIVLVTTSFPDEAFLPGQEAAGTFVADFAEELAKHIRVALLAPSSHNALEHYNNNLTIHRFAVPSLPLSLLKASNPSHWWAIFKTLRAGKAALEKTVATIQVDHIFALWVLPSGYWARRICQKRGIPYSTWALGSDIWNLRRIPLIGNVLKTVLLDSRIRFADGLKLAEDVAAISRLDCRFLPSARKLPVTDAKRLSVSPPYRLAFLGRWHRNKGVDLLLDSLFLLTDEDWRSIESVRICGGGPLLKSIKSAYAILKENGRPISLGGYLNREEAAELLTWADYLLLPSRIESIPVVFSDAVQARCPIISTPVGDMPRLLRDYQVGLLADAITPNAFAKAIRRALGQAPASFSSNLKIAATKFDVKTIASNFLELKVKEGEDFNHRNTLKYFED